MGVNYALFDAKKVSVAVYHGAPCYAEVFDGGMPKRTTEILLYEEVINVKEEVTTRWIKYLNRIGFPCTYLGKGKAKYDFSDNWDGKINTDNYYLFSMDITRYKYNNQVFSALTLLRYLFEGTYHSHVNRFFEIRDTEPKIQPFKALQLAFTTNAGGGHQLHNGHYNFYKLKDVFGAFEKYGGNAHAARSSLHECWQGKRLIKKANTRNFKNLYKQMNNKNLKTAVFVVGDKTYANWLPNSQLVNDIKDADVVLFTGGEDVSPELYCQKAHPRTTSNRERDDYEVKIYKEATELGIKKLGICRGSQFLCVMAGGVLVQHQDNPQYIHEIDLYNGQKINITSTHHQAAFPFFMSGYRYKVLGWTRHMSAFHENGDKLEMCPMKECEIVYYPGAYSLGIQGHPEHVEYQRDPNNAESLKALKTIYTNFINDKL